MTDARLTLLGREVELTSLAEVTSTLTASLERSRSIGCWSSPSPARRFRRWTLERLYA